MLALGVSMGWAPGAMAQGGPQSMEELIQALQTLGQTGQFPGIGGSGSTLDRVRDQANASAKEALESVPINKASLSSAEKTLARAFCERTLPEENLDVIDTFEAFSALERDYCTRANELLLQIGYEMFNGQFGPEALLNGSAPDNFKLGIGDKLIITFVGQNTSTSDVTVDREGRVSIRELPPILAAGLTIDAFRRELNARASTAFIGTEAFVSLGSVRAISVLVAGEVTRPGLQQATGFSTVIDALGLAGGIKKTGTLRRIEVHRGDSISWIDLYDLALGRGRARDLTLEEGDRIIVPPIGATIAVAGDVKRPGIFELAEGQERAEYSEIMRFVGGALRPRGIDFRRVAFEDSGLQRIEQVAKNELFASDGDLIVAQRRLDSQQGGVEMVGHVDVPGTRSLARAPTLAALLGSKDALKDDPYLLLGVLETEDPVTSARRYFAVSLENIFEGVEDYALRDDDRLIILGRDDIAYLSSPQVQQIISVPFAGEESGQRDSSNIQSAVGRASDPPAANLGTLEQIAARVSAERAGEPIEVPGSSESRPLGVFQPTCQSLVGLRKLVSESRSGRFSNAVIGTQNVSRFQSLGGQPCRALFEENTALLPFLIEHGAAISGEVRLPGIYPIAADTSLSSVAAVAGGVTREVDLSRIHVSRFEVESGTGSANLSRLDIDANNRSLSEIMVGPGDVVRFDPVFTDRDNGPVFLIGEFVRPGTYEIRRGERLSEVMARAGGPTAQAYPFGALFTRERVKRAEEESLKRLARELNSAVTVAAANRGIDASAVASFAQLTRDVATVPASGRVVMEADPTVLQVRPELDIVLEPGDRIFMPKRPNSVLVTGDVLNPGAMQFVSGKSLDTYIRQAGGFQQSADRRRLFVIFPNGSAQPVSVSPFNYTPLRVPPGSAIVVPKDATPFDVFTITREVASLVSQLAITAASLAVISSN